ncbi:MAG TPA: hypothetical protein VFH97_05995, partial [Gemmatimonadales bacterium]|nr:hypothetical protein [Gemmatimonadales bacterium]
DKITVWDSGKGGGGSGATADFLSSLIGALPAVHELARQAGIELPSVLGKVTEGDGDGVKPVATQVVPAATVTRG